MQNEPTYEPFFATPEMREGYIERFNLEYWFYPTDQLCACGSIFGKFNSGVHLASWPTSRMRRLNAGVRWSEWRPASFHSIERCGLSEADLQMECKGPYRKGTGAYVGCTNCEPYVRLAETRDSPYVYGVQFNDFNYSVFDGDTLLDGVMEVKVGVGGYIIQVRRTPDPHMCPCYLLEPNDPEIEPKVCRMYIPGNGFRVEEMD